MAKEIVALIKLQIEAGKANPAPPVGPALGQHGVNIMEFCKQFNAATQKVKGNLVPVAITVYKDKSFRFITKQPPASRLILKALGIKKGSAESAKVKVGKLSDKQLTEIALSKLPDLNAYDIDAAKRIIAGTAQNMGIEVE